ncbi:MAG: trigger factor [Candidatus Omnitrophica bacterium]|nr:trigger factor [Candidatus Omnitrophota bacterium]
MEIEPKPKEISPCEKELQIQVPLKAVEEEFDRVYEELKKVAHVPGFRVGHAPRDLLARYHGAKARENVLNRLIDRSLEEALKAHRSLDIVGRPVISDIRFDPGQPLSYKVKLEVAPEVLLGRYKGLKLSRPKARISEESVASVLAQLQEVHAQLRPALEARAAAEGDFLLADLVEEQKGKAPVRRRDLVIELNLKKDPAGILSRLVGMSPGEKRSVQPKEGQPLTVELKQIKVKDLPPLDDAFAKTIGPFESLEALTSAVRQDMERQARESQQQALNAQAMQQLMEGSSFEVPPSLVASQARRLLKERALEAMSQGAPSAEVEERAKVMAEQAKMEALKQVKLFFILRRIAAAEGISAGAEEVEGRIQGLAQRLGRSVEETRQELESKDLLEDLGWSIARAKVLDLIVREASIQEES